MQINSTHLTIELNKILLKTNMFLNGSAVESKGPGLATCIRLNKIASLKEFNKLLETITTKLSINPDLQNNFTLIYKTDVNGNPSMDRGLFVYVWNNPDEYQEALKAKLTLEMESLLDVKKLELSKYEAMKVTLEALKNNKQNTTKPLDTIIEI